MLQSVDDVIVAYKLRPVGPTGGSVKSVDYFRTVTINKYEFGYILSDFQLQDYSIIRLFTCRDPVPAGALGPFQHFLVYLQWPTPQVAR